MLTEYPISKRGTRSVAKREDRGEATSLEAWREWHRECALDLSSERTRDALCKFASHRFKNWAAKYIRKTNAGHVSNIGVSARQAWHLFESHVTVKQTREGKAYKKWLFARCRCSTENELDVVQGGASLIMRDVVRDYLVAEFSSSETVSIATNVGHSDGTPLTIGDLLPGEPDPSHTIALREISGSARHHAGSLFDEMNRRERIALLAKQARISLAHPVVLDAAGCGKSALNEAYGKLQRRVHGRLTADDSQAESRSTLALATLCLGALIDLLSTWSAADEECTGLLELIKEFAGV